MKPMKRTAPPLRQIRARYVEIHKKAQWGNSEECFEEDVRFMDVEMLLGLAAVYNDLAAWKQSYELGTLGVTSGNPLQESDLAA
jgi:hypothetical protein